MNPVTIHHEVQLGAPGEWSLCFQAVTYNYEGDRPSEDGYRFIWRRPNGNLQAARGQARIPSPEELFRLLKLASDAGWFDVSAAAMLTS